MRRPVLGLTIAGLTLAGAAGCVTRTPSAPDPSLAALPSLAASLPAVPLDSPTSAGPAAITTTTGKSPAPGAVRTTRPPATETTTTTATTTAAAHVPTTTELRRALLGSGDLAGFQVDGGTGDGGGEGGCPALDTDFSSAASAKAEVLLFQTSSSVFLRERLRQLGASAARAALQRVRSAPHGCGSFTTTVDPLGEVTVTVGTLGIGSIGDGSAAVRITMRPKSQAVVAIENLVLVRRGGTLIILTHTALTSIDDGLTSRTAAKAYGKTQRVW